MYCNECNQELDICLNIDNDDVEEFYICENDDCLKFDQSTLIVLL